MDAWLGRAALGSSFRRWSPASRWQGETGVGRWLSRSRWDRGRAWRLGHIARRGLPGGGVVCPIWILLLHHFWFVKVDGPADARDLGSPSPFGSCLSSLPSSRGARDQRPDASTTELLCCCVSSCHPRASSVPATHHQYSASSVLFPIDVSKPPLPASNSVKFAVVVGMRQARPLPHCPLASRVVHDQGPLAK